LPVFVRSFVARHVTSLTTPSKLPTPTQWPTRNGFSTWIARPANMFPSVSCSAKPMTTAPTADVVRNFSCITTVATIRNRPMMIVSWTMFGNCSGTRSARSGLMAVTTIRLMIARAMHNWITDSTRAAMSGVSSNRPRKIAATTYTSASRNETLSLRRTRRFTLAARMRSASRTTVEPMAMRKAASVTA